MSITVHLLMDTLKTMCVFDKCTVLVDRWGYKWYDLFLFFFSFRWFVFVLQ